MKFFLIIIGTPYLGQENLLNLESFDLSWPNAMHICGFGAIKKTNQKVLIKVKFVVKFDESWQQ